MKILVINNFFGPFGGAELAMLSTYQLLEQAGHEVAFFATDKQPYFTPGYAYAKHFPAHTDFDELKGIKGKLQALPKLFYNHQAEVQLEHMLARFRPDVVHCGNLYYHLSPAVLAACKKHGVPVVMTLHDPRLMCPAGTLMLKGETYCKDQLCVGGSALNCVKHRCYNQSLAHSVLVTAEHLFKNFHSLYDTVAHFITPSQGMRELAIKSGIPAAKVTTIYNCLQQKYLNIDPPTEAGGYFLYIGRISKEKGVSYLIEAMSLLPASVKLHIVGTGPDEAELKAKAQALGLTNVHFLGYMDGQQVIEQYQHCIASIMPSKWFEAFGLTAIETFACGRPVIGSRIGGIQEIIDDGDNGFLVEPESSEELARCMKILLDNPQRALEMGQRGKLKAESHFSPDLYTESVLNTYRRIVDKAPSLAFAR